MRDNDTPTRRIPPTVETLVKEYLRDEVLSPTLELSALLTDSKVGIHPEDPSFQHLLPRLCLAIGGARVVASALLATLDPAQAGVRRTIGELAWWMQRFLGEPQLDHTGCVPMPAAAGFPFGRLVAEVEEDIELAPVQLLILSIALARLLQTLIQGLSQVRGAFIRLTGELDGPGVEFRLILDEVEPGGELPGELAAALGEDELEKVWRCISPLDGDLVVEEYGLSRVVGPRASQVLVRLKFCRDALSGEKTWNISLPPLKPFPLPPRRPHHHPIAQLLSHNVIHKIHPLLNPEVEPVGYACLLEALVNLEATALALRACARAYLEPEVPTDLTVAALVERLHTEHAPRVTLVGERRDAHLSRPGYALLAFLLSSYLNNAWWHSPTERWGDIHLVLSIAPGIHGDLLGVFIANPIKARRRPVMRSSRENQITGMNVCWRFLEAARGREVFKGTLLSHYCAALLLPLAELTNPTDPLVAGDPDDRDDTAA